MARLYMIPNVINKSFFFITACLVFFPRVSMSGIFVPFSGLDFSPILIFLHFFLLYMFGNKQFGFNLARAIKVTLFLGWVNKYYFYFLILMLIFPFLFFFSGSFDFDSFLRSILQFYRHAAVILACIYFVFYSVSSSNCLYNNAKNNNLDVSFEYFLFCSMLIGVILSVLIAVGVFPVFSPSSDLTATPLFSSESSMIRFEGFSGSPTPFAVVCLIGMIYTFYIKKNYNLFPRWFVLLSLLIFSGCIFFTFSKSVLVFWFFVFFIFLLDIVKFGLFFRAVVWCFLMALFFIIVYYLINNPLVLDLFNRGVVSGKERFDIYSSAVTTIMENPVRWFIGSGWKSAVVGAHNEQLEMLLAFGFPFGILCIILLLLSIYKLLVSVSFDKYVVFLTVSMVVFSFFQEIYWNPSVMLVFLLFSIRITLFKRLSLYGQMYQLKERV